MSADLLLRRAADLLRKRAYDAPGGRWEATTAGLPEPTRAVAAFAGEAEIGVDVVGPSQRLRRGTADYIALMHPPVALALADWLDAEARHAEEWPDESEPACVVARAILREESP